MTSILPEQLQAYQAIIYMMAGGTQLAVEMATKPWNFLFKGVIEASLDGVRLPYDRRKLHYMIRSLAKAASPLRTSGLIDDQLPEGEILSCMKEIF